MEDFTLYVLLIAITNRVPNHAIGTIRRCKSQLRYRSCNVSSLEACMQITFRNIGAHPNEISRVVSFSLIRKMAIREAV